MPLGFSTKIKQSKLEPINPALSKAINELSGFLLGGKRAEEEPEYLGDEQRQALLDYFQEPIPLTGLEETAYGLGELAHDYWPQYAANLDSLIAMANELARTGFPTDLDPIIEREQRRFREEFEPALRERTNTLFSSDYQAQLGRELGRIGIDLGSLQVELDEAASNRRVTGIPLAATLAATPTASAVSLASDLSNLGSAYRGAQESVRPGARLYEALGGLTNLTAGQQYYVPGYDPQGSEFQQFLGALSGAVGAIGAAGIGGGGGGGGGAGIGGMI